MSAPTLDQLDRQLIDILAQDARVSNRKIAADLGVTEGTVRGRIKRLQQDGLIAFTAITSLRLEDSVKLAIIGVQAEYGRLRPIAEQIATLPNVDAVMIAMGGSTSSSSVCSASSIGCTNWRRTGFSSSTVCIMSKPRSR